MPRFFVLTYLQKSQRAVVLMDCLSIPISVGLDPPLAPRASTPLHGNKKWISSNWGLFYTRSKLVWLQIQYGSYPSILVELKTIPCPFELKCIKFNGVYYQSIEHELLIMNQYLIYIFIQWLFVFIKVMKHRRLTKSNDKHLKACLLYQLTKTRLKR